MNWTQVVQTFFFAVVGLLGYLKSAQWYFENERIKTDIKAKADVELASTKAKEAIETKKAEVELARANALAATQVAEVLKNQHEFINELEEIKKNMEREKGVNEEKNTQLLRLINKIEELVNKQTQNFTEFIMNRAK